MSEWQNRTENGTETPLRTPAQRVQWRTGTLRALRAARPRPTQENR